MPDQLPSGTMAVYVFLEMIALAFVFGAVEAFVNQKPWYIWAGCLALGVLIFLAGIKSGTRTGIAVVVILALVIIGYGVYRYYKTETPMAAKVPWSHGAKVEWGPFRGQVSPPTPTAPFFFNVYEPNTGQLDALNVIRSYAWRLTPKEHEELSEEELDKMMRLAKTGLMYPTSENISNRIAAGDAQTWFTINNPFIRIDDFNNILTSKRRLYLGGVMEYRDTDTPSGRGTFTEFCAYFEGSFSFYHSCKGHNWIYTAPL